MKREKYVRCGLCPQYVWLPTFARHYQQRHQEKR